MKTSQLPPMGAATIGNATNPSNASLWVFPLHSHYWCLLLLERGHSCLASPECILRVPPWLSMCGCLSELGLRVRPRWMRGWDGRFFSGRYMQSHEVKEATDTECGYGAERGHAYYISPITSLLG